MGGAVIGDFNAPKFGTKRGETRLGAGLTADHGGYSSSKKTVAGVRIAAGAAPAGLNLSNPRPPIWQATLLASRVPLRRKSLIYFPHSALFCGYSFSRSALEKSGL
jgi:hypothetical protein